MVRWCWINFQCRGVLQFGLRGVVWTYLLSTIFSPLSPSLWETARYRLIYYLKGPLIPNNQPTNHRRGVLLIWLLVRQGQGPTALAGGGRVVRWSWINFQVRGVLLVWIRVGQGPTALAVGEGGRCLDIFTLIYPFSFLSPSLWETTRYRL